MGRGGCESLVDAAGHSTKDVSLVLTLASLTIYGYVAFGNSALKIGFVFLVVPLASWVAMGIVMALVARRHQAAP